MQDRHGFAALFFAAVLVCAPVCAPAQVAVARVNGEPIYSDAVDRGFEEALRLRGLNITRLQNPAMARDLKREALDVLIRNELLWQKARDAGKVASDADVDAAIESTAATFKTRDAFERRVTRDGYDERGYREFVRKMLSADRAAQALVDAAVTVSDADIEAFYRANLTRFERPERVRLRMIRIGVAAPAGAAEREAARNRIAAARTQLLAGADFADLARRVSDHPTRPWGGEMDPVAVAELDPALARWVAGRNAGSLSEPLESPAGFELVRLEERMPAAVVPLAQARDSIRRHLTGLQGRAALDQAVAALRAQSRIEILLPQ